ncbi:hypothetical protein ANO11243_003830 [Dothideomycetidae sp. 11243]|nr:hypothetical protein ANO11243_003830 [fungal sp. No.11243]
MRTLNQAKESWLSLQTITDVEVFRERLQHPPLESRSVYWKARWNSLREDETLRAEIMQDVDRCMPENVFFRQQQTHAMMLDILFIFCKLNPDISYRQGMHELLAPVLWVVQCDAIQNGTHSATDDFMVSQLCDSRFIEHDSFTLFSLLMQNAKSFYEQKAHRRRVSLSSKPSSGKLENPILTIIGRIFDEYLPRLDPKLSSHLRGIELVPQVFLMRWIRLLFGREFPFDDVLPMWDIIFSEDSRLESVEMICLVMILRVRWELLDADHNTALSLLLRYPAMNDGHQPRDLVIDALKLRKTFNAVCAREIVLKYTGREVSQPDDLPDPDDFAVDDDLGSAHRPGSYEKSPKNFEKILQDAARNVFTQGEKWGINKAFRDAVDEVKRGVRDIQNMPTPQAPPRRHGRMQSRSSVSSITRRPDLELRLTALQQRNEQLAKLLKQATDELWEFQKNLTEEKGVDAAVVNDMSMSIARVGFVQVYLEDPSIPLPAEEPEDPPAPAPAEKPSSITITAPTTDPPPLPSTPPSRQSKQQDKPLPADPPSRPSLSHSSFSWILGQSSPPTSSSPFQTSSSSSPQRTAAARGFLFGTDEDEEEAEAKNLTPTATTQSSSLRRKPHHAKRAIRLSGGRKAGEALNTLQTEGEGAGKEGHGDGFDLSELTR